MIDAKYSAVVGSACSCECEAGSDREVRSSDVCYVGDTRWSFSAKIRTASCALVISSVSCHMATWLCGARECSLIRTIVKPQSDPTSAQSWTMTRDILGVTDLAPTVNQSQ